MTGGLFALYLKADMEYNIPLLRNLEDKLCADI